MRSQLRQGISNLCTNACDALEALPEDDTRTARILLKPKYKRSQRLLNRRTDTSAPAVLSLSACPTTGIGMDDAMQEHLRAFYSSGDIERGTGLGLSTLYTIISEHKGWLHCESELDRGTTITIFLPIIESDHQAESALVTTPRSSPATTIYSTQKNCVGVRRYC